jgi:WD40 repeat protein
VGVIEVAVGYGREPGKFRVEVVRSAAGQATADAGLDVSGLLAERTRFQETLLLSAVRARQVLTPAEQVVRETGQALFSALLGTGEVAGQYRASAALADERGEDLRIVLRIGAPELAALPWEGMYDPGAGGYVCRQHQLVRHVPVAAVPPPLHVQTPLRVLGVISAPRGLAPLDAGREREQLEHALSGLAERGLAEVAWAPPTWAGLHEMLLAGPWHVLHYVGHGDFDPDRDEGVLALTGDDGRADLVEASRLADLLRQARPMPRLVVLNSCSGAETGPGDLFSGTAAALARSGVAAVAAMQFAISDPAAVAFSRGFYAALAHGRGVDESVSAGRIAILGGSAQTLEWITPVLYLRGDDTQLFTITPATVPPAAVLPAGGSSPAPAARSALEPALSPEPRALVPSRPLRTLTGHASYVHGLAFSADGTLLATASSDKTARIWDTATGALTRTLAGRGGHVLGVAFSPDGTQLATASDDGRARIWDTVTGSLARTLTGHTNAVHAVAFSPDGTQLATASRDKTLLTWDTATGTRTRTLARHGGPVNAVAFGAGGTLLATASDDKTALIWDTATGSLIHTLTGHAGAVSAVAFSPDGALLASAGRDEAVLIWDTATGRLARALTVRGGQVHGVAFSPDGALLATASYDTAVLIWGTATGTLARALTGHGDQVNALAFSPDGAVLATASDDKTARLWA